MKVGVVIVNYNCAPLALDAALSAIGDDPSARVVIVDNASTDDSRGYFTRVIENDDMHQSEAPKAESDLPHFASLEDIATGFESASAQLTVLYAEENKGFAAGCNLGLRFLQECCAPDMFVLLNPDAVLVQGAMDAFRARLSDQDAGLCGASILRFENPECAQAFGGASLNPLTLLGENIGSGKSLLAAPERAQVEKLMSYPLGAALAFRKDYLEIAGYLDERFFLYYEEADWTRRGEPMRKPVWARDAIVYHRHGAAAGSRQEGGERSALSDFHMARSPVYCPIVGNVHGALVVNKQQHWFLDSEPH